MTTSIPLFAGGAALLLCLITTSCVAPNAGKPSAKPAKPRTSARTEPSPFSFSLLPKSLQANPELDMTVFTEMTPEGAKLTPPTREQPVYFVAQPDGFKQLGLQVGGEKPPPAVHIDYFVRKALAKSGYLSVPSVEISPSLLILYRWGTHNATQPMISEDLKPLANAEVLARARLVGGPKLVAEMRNSLEWGDFMPQSDAKRMFLKDQAFDSCYFVIIFAYDFDAAVRGQMKLYWRTNMTVNTRGVSLKETLSPLIASAAPFFGKNMTEAEVTSRPLYRRATVDIGEAVVVEEDVKSPEDENRSSGATAPVKERKRPR